MNSYSLTSDSPRWWWPSAAAGTAGAAAIVAILTLPGAVQAVAEPIARTEPAGSVYLGGTLEHQCFLLRSPWNEALDGNQPRCFSSITVPAPRGVWRPGLDDRP